MSEDAFAERLLAWFDRHGRRGLPWKRRGGAYVTWVSEVMLQQTRVSTVIPYFERFVARFPDVIALANAPADDVLHLWSGLGYYARARNLQRAAREIRDRHGGAFPDTVEAVAALPGIGRSTAGAILSLAFGQRHPILDGNVKRVLARVHAVEGWPGRSAVAARLWALAERHTPRARVGEYNQAIMDLGAGVCTRAAPACDACPVAALCAARASGRQGDYPGRRPAKATPVRSTCMLLVTAGGEVLLERRPPSGLWGGLWSLPEVADAGAARAWCQRTLGAAPATLEALAPFRHTFSHFHLDVTPLRVTLDNPTDAVMEGGRYLWYNGALHSLGLAAPVQRLIERQAASTEGA